MSASSKRIVILLAKLLLTGVVVWFVGGAFVDAWRQLSEQSVRIAPAYALGSAAMLIVAQMPMAFYWRRTLQVLHQPAPLGRAISAYYVSQIGKYVPGKAAVVAIRVERMLGAGARARSAAAAVFYETLTLMAAGGLLSAALLSVRVLSQSDVPLEGAAVLAGLSLGLAVLCLAPTAPPIANRLVERLTSPASDHVSPDTNRPRFTWALMAEGWGASALAWAGMAVSVWLAARSVGAVGGDPSTWLLAAALPVVAGFLSLLPAGVLVRDGLMLTLLTPEVGEAGALAATLSVRVIWLVAEALVCVILMVSLGRRSADDTGG